jgi:hypothetical protein
MPTSGWSPFFTTTASSAAALTGLMFVVITLVRDVERAGSDDGIGGFSTPTVIHFTLSLLVSAVLCAPWPVATIPGIVVALVAIGGIGAVVRATWRTRRLRNYVADMEDCLWYTVAPLLAYGVMLAGAARFIAHAKDAPFEIAGSVLLLIFIGIRNAWDVVTFLATGKADSP